MTTNTEHAPLKGPELPDFPLTDDQIRIRDLERQLANARQGLLEREQASSPLRAELMDHDIPVRFYGTLSFPTSDAGGTLVGVVSAYGDDFVLTLATYEAARDRLGNVVWDRLLSPETGEDLQRQRFGRVLVRRGSWPPDESRLEYGSVEWNEQAAAARAVVAHIQDPVLRQAALARHAAQWGPPPASNVTTAVYKGDE